MTDKAPEEVKPVTKTNKIPIDKPRVKKQWKNPALRMMGIPRFSLPSRNWMIFWSVCAGIGGGIWYDKREQSKIRIKWMEEVKNISEQKYGPDRLPRKLTIYIAPPPNDFLESSLKVFRKFVKPVLNASAIDYQIYTENRQGDIRSAVAQSVRELRLKKLQEQKDQEELEAAAIYNKSWTKFFKQIPGYFKPKSAEDEAKLTSRAELYKPVDVLGLYHLVQPVDVVSDDEDFVNAGGVICIGRGAYKEFMTGVHEGLLGPLEKPQELIDEEQKLKEEKEQKIQEKLKEGKTFDDDNDEDEDGNKKKDPVTKPYINPEQYGDAKLAPELDWSQVITNDKVPAIFEQPIYVFPVPNLLGFLKTPEKIYRYYTTRRLADDYGFRTTSIVYNKSRKFLYKDTLMAKEEELDWPKKWIETGKEKNAEWVKEVEVDERITSRFRVFDPKLVEQGERKV